MVERFTEVALIPVSPLPQAAMTTMGKHFRLKQWVAPVSVQEPLGVDPWIIQGCDNPKRPLGMGHPQAPGRMLVEFKRRCKAQMRCRPDIIDIDKRCRRGDARLGRLVQPPRTAKQWLYLAQQILKVRPIHRRMNFPAQRFAYQRQSTTPNRQ